MTGMNPEIFVAEKYVLHKEILVNLRGYGWGIRIPADKLGSYILQKRVHPNLILNRDFVTIIHETAVKDAPLDTRK